MKNKKKNIIISLIIVLLISSVIWQTINETIRVPLKELIAKNCTETNFTECYRAGGIFTSTIQTNCKQPHDYKLKINITKNCKITTIKTYED